MGRVLGIVRRAISSHITKKAGFTQKTAQTGALNLNVHFHIHRADAPDQQELVHTISHRVDVTPVKRGKGSTHQESEDKTSEQRRQAMTWALCSQAPMSSIES